MEILFCSSPFGRKLLHKVVHDGKDVAQEENYLPKYQRVKDLCQRAEYQTPCEQIGQVQTHVHMQTCLQIYTDGSTQS